MLNHVGALPRDPVDQRIITDVINGTGKIINSQDEVGGWPILTGEPEVDTNRNGIPDWWEIKHGLDANDPELPKRITDSGYTVIEEYLNWKASSLINNL